MVLSLCLIVCHRRLPQIDRVRLQLRVGVQVRVEVGTEASRTHQFELRVNIITEIKSGILIKTQLHLQPQTHEQKGVAGGGRRGRGGRQV